MVILEIQNFIEDYELYSSFGTDIDIEKLESKTLFNKKYISNCYVPSKKEDSIEIGDIIMGEVSKNFYLVEEIGIDKIKGHRFEDAELKIPLKPDYGECFNKSIIPIYKSYSNIHHNLKEFVFSLPTEDQNIILNQKILETTTNINIITDILYDAYREEKHFKEYFEVVNKEAQNQAVNALRHAQERNLSFDSFLWDKGFKEVNLDYMRLYKRDADEFIEYFKSKKPDDKKTILKGIMKYDYTNKAVADWLDENELDLIREVSLDG